MIGLCGRRALFVESAIAGKLKLSRRFKRRFNLLVNARGNSSRGLLFLNHRAPGKLPSYWGGRESAHWKN